MSEEAKAVKAMRTCHRWERCGIPICPLDPMLEERTYITGEKKCRLGKAKRHKYGKQVGAIREGLTPREWAWQQLSETEKERRANVAKQFLPQTTSQE